MCASTLTRLVFPQIVQPLTLRIREKGKDSNNPPELKDPKHGKEDDENKPHVRRSCACMAVCLRVYTVVYRHVFQVGGSTWAGGTGGSNTAGLGGRGGPYRLDKGHSVHQVCDLLYLSYG